MKKTAALLVMLVAATLPALAQPVGGCVEKSDQFNFWVGEWNVTANGKQAGTNSIQPNWLARGGSRQRA